MQPGFEAAAHGAPVACAKPRRCDGRLGSRRAPLALAWSALPTNPRKPEWSTHDLALRLTCVLRPPVACAKPRRCDGRLGSRRAPLALAWSALPRKPEWSTHDLALRLDAPGRAFSPIFHHIRPAF
eukprot:scaffold52188_cov51-Phaeocystis_antarctica.AAC.1